MVCPRPRPLFSFPSRSSHPRCRRPITLSHKVTSQHLKKRKRGSQMTTQRTKAGLGPSRIGPRRRPLGQGSARDDENVYIKDGDADAEGSTARTHARQVPQDGFRRGRRRGNWAVAGMHDQGQTDKVAKLRNLGQRPRNMLARSCNQTKNGAYSNVFHD
ncbi:hypothetical protein DFH09DRAFT_1339215 [Mycena vulgaris]|nr:hypothetical protein DFH09DRAFT_1339215 [Mycena vulgaris]